MILSPTRKGELLCGTQAFLWSFFPVVTVMLVREMPPIFAAALATSFSILFFACMLTLKKLWRELLVYEAWMDIALTSLFLGVLYYCFLFIGLQTSGAGNGSILSLTELLFAFLILGVILRHESLTTSHIVGALLIVAGAVLVLLPKTTSWLGGEWFIILGAACAPFGNFYAQRALKRVSAVTILFLRSILAGCVLLLLSMLIESPLQGSISPETWVLLIGSGFLLFGLSKIFWTEAIRYIPITKCNALASAQPILTLLWAALFLGERATLWQIGGFIPMFVGILLLTRLPHPTPRLRSG